MQEYIQYVALLLVGLVAGIINVTAGGGSTLTLPALIFIGLDSAVANGTNRVSIIFQNISAVSSFKRGSEVRFKQGVVLALFAIPGAVIGSVVATKISNELFERRLGIVLILVIISMLIPGSISLDIGAKVNSSRAWLANILFFGIGFYGGFIQVGIGLAIMAVLYHVLRMDLVTVNFNKAVIILIYTIPALLVFTYSGNVNLKLGLVLAAGSAIGGWVGAHLNIKGGDRFIRYFMFVAILIISLKLLGVFNYLF